MEKITDILQYGMVVTSRIEGRINGKVWFTLIIRLELTKATLRFKFFKWLFLPNLNCLDMLAVDQRATFMGRRSLVSQDYLE